MATSYGLVPDPWQARILADWLRVREGRWAASRCGTAVPRQNGKNGALEVRELYGMVALGERILHTAHEVKTARKAFLRLLEFFENERKYPELASMVREIRKTNGQEAVVLDNGGSVEFVARSRGSGRGFSVDVLVCDEAQDLSEDERAALSPTISASNNPQTIYTGTPPKPGRVAGSVFRRIRDAGVAGGDPRLAWSEWSCPDELGDVDLDDEALWAATNPALGTRLLLETVRDERRDFSDETFARERLGWWEPDADGFSAFPSWPALLDVSAVPSSPVFGVDMGEDRLVHIAAAWRAADGSRGMLTQTADGVVDTGLTASQAVSRLSELFARWRAPLMLGGPALLALEQPLEDAGVPFTPVKAAEFAAGCGLLRDAVRDGSFRHGNQSVLNEAARLARWRSAGTSGEQSVQLKDAPGVGPLAALVRALWGLVNVPDYDLLDSVR